ncbi:MAG: hypothetical protein R3A80_04895 [Bdellovibrionota bacterium]
MDTIVAGESYSGSCPEGMKAEIYVGDKLPSPENPSVQVLEVNGSNFVLGPMKAGEVIVNIPCDSSFQKISFLVNEMPPEAAMNRYAPLGSEKVEYPSSIYILIAVIVLSPVLAFLAYYFKKKKVTLKQAPFKKIKKTPRELLEEELKFFETNVQLPESHHFHTLYKRIRKFIEKELNLKTRSHTTQEFLGTFRALALQQSANQTIISQLEYLLRTADDVRFAGKTFTADLWKDYLQKTHSIILAFPPKVEEVKKK